MSVENKVMSLHVHAYMYENATIKTPLNRWYSIYLLTKDNNEFKIYFFIELEQNPEKEFYL